jgi:hypothetical protein
MYVLDRKQPLSSGFLALLHCHGSLREESGGSARNQGSLVHVVDPTGYNGLQLYVRPISEVSDEHL